MNHETSEEADDDNEISEETDDDNETSKGGDEEVSKSDIIGQLKSITVTNKLLIQIE